MKRIILLFGAVITAAPLCAQFSFNGQYMSRGEMRHGFQTLADTNQKAAYFVSQRSRVSGDFKSPKFRVHLSIQDIRTWGSTANNTIDTKGLLSVYEAYGEIGLAKNLNARVGRQAISHGDERIFGSLDWAMQGRRHDAVVVKYRDTTLTLESGLSYNQDAETQRQTPYTVNNYKFFQYLWYQHQIKNFNLGALLLNTGFTGYKAASGSIPADTFTYQIQTIGMRGEYREKLFSAGGFIYLQTGTDALKRQVSAFDASLEASLFPIKGMILSLGTEYLSGTSQVDTANKINRSFNPLFGTNHRFNGYMDYFYVGNHLNTVGLHDVFFKSHYSYGHVLAGASVHVFNAAADIRNKQAGPTDALSSRHLGTELDLTASFLITDGAAVQCGYSRFFGTHALQTLRGVAALSPVSHWAYVMLLIRPQAAKWPRTGLKL